MTMRFDDREHSATTPSTRAAAAALDQARAAKLEAQAAVNTGQLNVDRTVIRAPMDGIVARRRVQVGERVTLGSELLAIVPVDQAYVEANFKETQLRKIRVGQPVALTADRYGSSVAPIVQKLMPKIDNRLFICGDLLLLAAATAWKATFTSNVTFWMLFFALGSMGIGLALMFLPIMPAVLGMLKPKDVASGAGLMNFCRTTSMAFAAVIITTTWNNAATENRVALINQMPGTNSLASLGLPKAQQPFVLDALVQEQSVMLATVQMYGVLVVIMVIAAMSLWLIHRPAAGGAPPVGGH